MDIGPKKVNLPELLGGEIVEVAAEITAKTLFRQRITVRTTTGEKIWLYAVCASGQHRGDFHAIPENTAF